ncbi:hypothetical protein [Mesorhizobium sp. M0060]|uniref:hypothetical protein n=1 Tax=Mesorhizobium sp. M0060 TaxID=2956866 RepID=UPI00333B1008
MIAVDTAYFQTFRRRSTGFQAEPLRALEVERVVRKVIGFIVTLTTVAAVYWILPEYRRAFYAPYWAALYDILPALLVATPFYVAYVDCRQTNPEDSYAEIGAFVLSGAVPQRTEQIRQHVLGWIVKGFFLPLMFVYLCSTLGSILTGLEQPYQLDITRWHAFAIDLLFMVDVLIAVVGYVFTLRVLDNHIRTVEPTVFGWLVCLACYEPITAEALRHSAILLGLNAVYALRAITEERHLSRDPDYVAYCDYIAENGAVALLKRLFATARRSPMGRSAE